MQKPRAAVGTFPMSYLISHLDLTGLPLQIKMALVKNLDILNFTEETYAAYN